MEKCLTGFQTALFSRYGIAEKLFIYAVFYPSYTIITFVISFWYL